MCIRSVLRTHLLPGINLTFAQACSDKASTGVGAEVAKFSKNTKIVEFPLHVGDEQDTLALIDEVLNGWGR